MTESATPLTDDEQARLAARVKPYNFTVKLKSTKGHEIGIDPAAEYGYWEWPDGSEGGGLWFDVAQDNDPKGPIKLELIDYDGASCIPPSIIAALRAAGYAADDTFD